MLHQNVAIFISIEIRFKCDVCNAIFSPVTRGVDRRHCFVQLPPTQQVPTPLFCVIFGHTHMCRCVCVRVCVCGWVCAQSVCKQTAYKPYTRPGQASLGRQRPVDMPNRRRRPAASPLLRTLVPFVPFVLLLYCTVCVAFSAWAVFDWTNRTTRGDCNWARLNACHPLLRYGNERVELYHPPPLCVVPLFRHLQSCAFILSLGYGGSSTKPISQKTKKA